MNPIRLAPLAVACLLAACASTARMPQIPVPPQYGARPHDDNARTATAISGHDNLGTDHNRTDVGGTDAPIAGDPVMSRPRQTGWWRAFGEAELDLLVDDVIARNRDLEAAALRVERAGLLVQDARGARLPIPSASASDSRSTALDGGPLRRSATAQLGVGYEIDLWGRLRNAERVAQAGLRAYAADRDSAELSLAANVCDLYWQLADANFRIARADDAVLIAERTRALVQAQYAAGAVSGLELAEADQNLYRQVDSRSRLAQSRDALRGALAVLRDGLWWPPQREPQRIAAQTLPIATGLPAELLGRRPDLRVAEWRLRQSLREADDARLSAYPRITLDLGLSGSGAGFGDVASAPVTSLLGGLVLPLIDARGTRLRIAAAQTDYAIAEREFRQSLQQAIGEVEDARADRQWLTEQMALADASLAQARRIEALYAVRYRAGVAPLRLWLDAQQSLRSAESTRSQAALALRRNEIALIKALGGSGVLAEVPTATASVVLD